MHDTIWRVDKSVFPQNYCPLPCDNKLALTNLNKADVARTCFYGNSNMHCRIRADLHGVIDKVKPPYCSDTDHTDPPS